MPSTREELAEDFHREQHCEFHPTFRVWDPWGDPLCLDERSCEFCEAEEEGEVAPGTYQPHIPSTEELFEVDEIPDEPFDRVSF